MAFGILLILISIVTQVLTGTLDPGVIPPHVKIVAKFIAIKTYQESKPNYQYERKIDII